MSDLHTRTPVRARLLSWARLGPCLAPIALTLAACQPEIGDPCKRAIDCGLQVVRQCDVSNADNDPNREGECILENCSLGVCPKEAICIKVYASEFASTVCEPALEDLPMGEDLVARDDCLPSEVCLPEGLCGDELRAQTSCRRECKSDADCRSTYMCENTGRGGVYVAPDPKDPDNVINTRICVPRE